MATKEQIRILIVDDVAETRENLRKLLSFAPDIEIIGAAASGQEGIELAKQFQPHIILMDINMPGMDGIAATEAILQEVPMTQVVVLSVQGESDYLRRAMLAGARDFLTKPPSGDELMGTIRQVYETGKKRAAVVAPTQQVAQAAAPTTAERLKHAGNIIAVYSPKGGVGCTTVAVNLAIALQQQVGTSKKIGLVDANFQFGDIGVMLNLSAGRSIADLVSQFDTLDNDMLSSALSAHGSGVKVLLAPPHPEAADSLMISTSDGGMGGSSALKPILSMMRQEFDIIIVDMWSRVDDVALTLFDMTTMIVLVVTPNIPAIKNARMFLEIAGKLGYPTENIALVVNRADRRTGIRVDQIAQALIPVAAQIPPDDQAVLTAANRGVPFVMHDQSRPIAQGILQLSEYILNRFRETDAEQEEEDDEAGRRLGRLFR
ncbi:MAG: response regulator [Anaerolineae bacterium]|nr:response regulator [Anaerolineae bacterium]